MDIIKLVEKPTWRDLLIRLVEKKDMDPWDIDIIELTNGFVEHIKNMKSFDLKVPANLLLAAAILLKFKSKIVGFEESPVIEEAPDEMEVTQVDGEYILTTKQRFPPKRKVSMEELMKAMEEAIRMENFGVRKTKQTKLPEIVFTPTNNEEKIIRIFERVKEKADDEGMVLFSELLFDETVEEKINVFIPIIYLAHDNKVKVWQEELFGDLFVKLM